MRFSRLGDALWVPAAGLAVALGAGRAAYGLDRTDEGQYLQLIRDPSGDPATVFSFGYFLRPVMFLLGGDVRGLRLVGFAITAALAAALLVAIGRRVGATAGRHLTGRAGLATLAALAAVGAVASLIAFAWFPMTPSYNTMALWGVLVAACGLTRLTDGQGPDHAGRGCVLTGLGVALAGLGKPTSGVAALVVALAAILATSLTDPAPRAVTAHAPSRWGVVGHRLTSLLGGLALGGLALVVVSWRSPADLLRTARAGLEGVQLLQGHEQLLRFDPIDPAAPIAAFGGLIGRTAGPTTLQALWLIPLAAACVALAGTVRARRARRGVAAAEPTRAVDPRTAVLLPALVTLPLCYSFGTNGNLWAAPGRAAPLWIAALLLAIGLPHGRPKQSARAIGAALAALVLVAGVGLAARDTYYRYPAPDGSRTAATIDTDGNTLDLTADDAAATAALLRDGAKASGHDVLDTTGASAGYIYQLGAHPVGSSWLIGGYPGSADAARHALGLESCERVRSAYVLYSPDSPRRIEAILGDHRLTPDDYRVLATIKHQLGWKLQLLEPGPNVAKKMPCRPAPM